MTLISIEQKNNLCSVIRTTNYARKIITLLRDVSDNLYKLNDKNYKDDIKSFVDEDVMDVINDILKDTDSSKTMEIEERFREIIEFLKQAEEITFTIPVHPSKDFIKRLFDWCSQNIKAHILLEFITNRVMDSGFLMIYKGHYYEYSLDNLLNEYFVSHKISKYFDLGAK